MEVTVICDFDGTITTEDIGDIIIEKFASATAKAFAMEYYAGTASSMDVDTAVYDSMKQSKEELVQYTKENTVIRDGFFEFLDFCKLSTIEFIVISGGYDYYIQAVLGQAASYITIKANSIIFLEDGAKKIDPLRFNSTCGKCGNCKALYCEDYLKKGNMVVFIGDSVSDVCAVQKAHHRFARHRLKDILDEKQIVYDSYDTFFDIMKTLKENC
jgi:2-hydroxy-3-keto-5-methylthiopentenyl-1-phosphate phosphatase